MEIQSFDLTDSVRCGAAGVVRGFSEEDGTQHGWLEGLEGSDLIESARSAQKKA